MARIAVVTGSASGMGKATADLMRQRGDRVIGVDLHDADVIADLSTAEGRCKMVEDVSSLAGSHVDAVLGNAGVLGPDDLCYAVNYHGAIATMEGLRPMLARSISPRGVITSSLAVLSPPPPGLVEALEGDETPEAVDIEGAGYIVSKHAIARWVRKAAPTADWAGAGILLNAICPGLIDTPMQRASAEAESVQQLIQSIPLGRVGSVCEIAEAFAFFASEASRYITGQLLFVDGGLEASSRPLNV